MAGNLSDNAGLALSKAVADAVELAGALTVLVNARRRLPLSGLLVAADLVLTASHGVERETDIQVELPGGSVATAALAGRDPGSDLAVLKLQSAAEYKPVEHTTAAARVGNLVVAVGRPSSEGVQASFGMITGIGGALPTHHGSLIESYLVTDAVPLPGFSGGPLVDLGGSVLGINTSGLVHGASLAIPISIALDVAHRLAEHGSIKRGFLGIRSQPVEIPAASRSALGREQSSGLLVVGVESGGPSAAAGGLIVGDILVGINGHPVSDHEALMVRLAGDVAGKPTQVEVLRGGQPVTLTITLGER